MRWPQEIRDGVIGGWRSGFWARATPRALWRTAVAVRREDLHGSLLVRYHAENDPHRIAVRQGDRMLSFFALEEAVAKLVLDASLGETAPTFHHRPETLVLVLARSRQGRPKGAAATLAHLSRFERPEHEAHVAAVPLSDPTSRGLCVLSLLLGRTVILCEDDPDAVFSATSQHKRTTLHVSGATLEAAARRRETGGHRLVSPSLAEVYVEREADAAPARAAFGGRVSVLSAPRIACLHALVEENG